MYHLGVRIRTEIPGILLPVLLLANLLFSQSAPSPINALPERRLDRDSSRKTVAVPENVVFQTCDPHGVIYGELLSPEPAAHKSYRTRMGAVILAPDGTAVRIVPSEADPSLQLHPHDFNRFDFSEKEIVLLTQVGERRTIMRNTRDGAFSGYPYIPMALLFYGHDGKLTRKVPLDNLPFQARGIALFASGRVFVAGEDMDTRDTRAAILNPDGTIFREFVSKASRSANDTNAVEWLPGFGPMKFHRIGNEVLFPPSRRNPMTTGLPWPFTDQPVVVIRADGTVRFVPLAPDGYALDGMAAAGNDWIALFLPKADLEASMKNRTRLVTDNVIAIRVDPENGLPLYRITGLNHSELHTACFLGDNIRLFPRTLEGQESRIVTGRLVSSDPRH